MKCRTEGSLHSKAQVAWDETQFQHGRPGRPLCFLLKQCRSGRRPCAGSASPCAYVAVGPWFGRSGLELGPSSIISELFRPIFRIFAIHLFLCQSFGTSHLSSAVEVMPAWKWYILPVVESQKERDESMTKVWRKYDERGCVKVCRMRFESLVELQNVNKQVASSTNWPPNLLPHVPDHAFLRSPISCKNLHWLCQEETHKHHEEHIQARGFML